MKRRFAAVIALALSMVMVSSFAFAAGDSDKAQIEQKILERVNKGRTWFPLKPVEDDQPLFPAVGEPKLNFHLWLSEKVYKPDKIYGKSLKNELDRFVFVKNTGNVDVYVRTWFAFEEGTYGKSVLDGLIHLNINSGDGLDEWTVSQPIAGQSIDGNVYTVFYADYNSAIKPDETAVPSLLQLYMDSTAGNEEVAAIDGDGDGKYKLMVLSQCVETKGFDDGADALSTAFGSIPWNNAPLQGEN